MFKTRRLRAPIILLAAIAAVAAPVNCHRPADQPGRTLALGNGKPPIIFIPGILGSRLVNRLNGETVWPDSNGDDLALPISSPVLAENKDDLIATEVLEDAKVRAFIPKVSVYGPLLKNLELYGGYRRGDFASPQPSGAADTFYVFPYDWRRDIVESARALGCAIEELKRRLGRPDLRFDIVAHSMGGLIARYYAMYGGRDVLYDQRPCPDWSGARNLGRIVMIGAPNAGSMNAFRVLLRGYSATDAARRSSSLLRKIKRKLPMARVSARVVFTAPAIYQLLPPQGYARFFDENLQPLPVALYEVETWRRYNWSAAFNTRLRQRELERLVKDLGPSAGQAESLRRHNERERFLLVALWRAAAFQNALAIPGPLPANLRFIIIGGDCASTLDGAVIITGIEPRTTFRPSDFSGENGLKRKVAELIFNPGDGIITRRSLLGHPLDAQSPVPTAMRSTPVETVFFCRTHNGLLADAAAQNYLLMTLLSSQQ